MQSGFVLGVMAVLACAPAIGREPGSSFAEFSYQHPEHGGRGEAFRLAGQPGQRLVLNAEFDARKHYEGDVGRVSLGAGWRLQDAGSLRTVLGLSLDAVGGAFDAPDESGMNGATFGAGFNAEVVHRVHDRLELLGRLKFTTMHLDPWIANIGARIYLGERLALTADWLNDEFGTRWGIGLRVDFSQY